MSAIFPVLFLFCQVSHLYGELHLESIGLVHVAGKENDKQDGTEILYIV